MNQFVRIQGIASREVQQTLEKQVSRWPEKQDSCILFLDYSDFDIAQGTVFTLLEDPRAQLSYPVRGELLNIMPFPFKTFDEIPKGYKTVCEIWFDATSTKLIKSKLSVVNEFGGNSNFFILTV